MRHESKCAHLHGHNYVAEITCSAEALDSVGRVVDFGVIKDVVGSWIDSRWDHGGLYHYTDTSLIDLSEQQNWKCFIFQDNPTAEVIASHLLTLAGEMLAAHGVIVTKVRVWETENCYAEASYD